MSGKKNTLIRKWAKGANMPFRTAKKTWEKLSAKEKEIVTISIKKQLEWDNHSVRGKVVAKEEDGTNRV